MISKESFLFYAKVYIVFRNQNHCVVHSITVHTHARTMQESIRFVSFRFDVLEFSIVLLVSFYTKSPCRVSCIMRQRSRNERSCNEKISDLQSTTYSIVSKEMYLG